MLQRVSLASCQQLWLWRKKESALSMAKYCTAGSTLSWMRTSNSLLCKQMWHPTTVMVYAHFPFLKELLVEDKQMTEKDSVPLQATQAIDLLGKLCFWPSFVTLKLSIFPLLICNPIRILECQFITLFWMIHPTALRIWIAAPC